MDRTEYLHLCQKASIYKDRAGRVKRSILPSLLVGYKSLAYFPNGYKMAFCEGTALHTAILLDLNANSEIMCALSEVERNGEREHVAAWQTITEDRRDSE